jgi:uncharacterized delta-60 repeat protein
MAVNVLRVFAVTAALLLSSPANAGPGDLDASFGSAGRADLPGFTTPGGQPGTAIVQPVALAAQANGGIVVAATVSDPGFSASTVYLGLVRFGTNGNVDGTFGAGGKVAFLVPGYAFDVSRMAIQPDQKIVVAGTFELLAPGAGRGYFLARFETNGQPDAGFGNAGLVAIVDGAAGMSGATGMRSLGPIHFPPGKILLVGGRYDSGSSAEIVLIRHDRANGAPDATFGAGGILVPGVTGPAMAVNSSALQPDGAVVASYNDTGVPPGQLAKFQLARFTTGGALDATFGGTGLVATDVGGYFESARNLVVQPDGRILAAGSFSITSDYFNYQSTGMRTALVRYQGDGTLDPTFGVAGKVTYMLRAVSHSNYASDAGLVAVALQPDGRLVAVGASTYEFRNSDLVLARFLPNGALDPTLRGAGKVFTDIGPDDIALDTALQGDGNVLVLGRNGDQGLVLRYEGGGGTAVVVESASGPVFLGQQVDFTASVFGVSPTGTITFRNAGADIAGCVDVALVAGTASCPGQLLPGGVNAITAAYSGDADDPAAISPAFRQLVLSATTDVDEDGIPDLVEIAQGTDPVAKDNDVFAENATGARLFAMQQYRDFLGREGDAPGVEGWAYVVQYHLWTREQVIDAFLQSQEFAGFVAPVVRLYFATFLRVPDYAGLAFNAGLVRSGAITPVQLADFFAASPEFQATYGSLNDTQFVTLLYSNVLGRVPDPAGLAGWLALLQSGYSRGQVLIGFSDSVEYQAKMANEVFVTMMYAGMLRRTPEPIGFSGWVSLLDAGTMTRQQVIDGFFLSTEYRARFLP